ncbi:hypothetical protein C5167_045452 [Papaver somniferum]|uniref:CN hydrolase domain-containing protein n=1 Tax=Papaver somniferum TaxID=3469 RepID=A0A4Y7LDG9_PAPSO|nr:hypothetical protein C5167_045452 [Papaver somniferum]
MALGLTRTPSFITRLPVIRPDRSVSLTVKSSLSMANNSNHTVRIAAAQMTSINDLTSNFNTCSHLVKEAVAAGAKMICFPENFSFVGARDGESMKIAEPLDGPIMQKYCSLARESNIWLSLGGFQEKGPDDTHLCNAHVLIDDTGHLRSTYRKIHLFDVDIPGGAVFKESSFTEAGMNNSTYMVVEYYTKYGGDCPSKSTVVSFSGKNIVVVDSPVGRLGLTVCYDLRFPELYQRLRYQHQAQVLLVPAAFTKITGEAHWEILLRARAIETQCYVIAAAQAGKHNDKRESYGDTLIIDPWGKVVGRLPDRASTGIVIADIDFSLIDSVRTKMPISEHMKPLKFWNSASP